MLKALSSLVIWRTSEQLLVAVFLRAPPALPGLCPFHLPQVPTPLQGRAFCSSVRGAGGRGGFDPPSGRLRLWAVERDLCPGSVFSWGLPCDGSCPARGDCRMEALSSHMGPTVGGTEPSSSCRCGSCGHLRFTDGETEARRGTCHHAWRAGSGFKPACAMNPQATVPLARHPHQAGAVLWLSGLLGGRGSGLGGGVGPAGRLPWPSPHPPGGWHCWQARGGTCLALTGEPPTPSPLHTALWTRSSGTGTFISLSGFPFLIHGKGVPVVLPNPPRRAQDLVEVADVPSAPSAPGTAALGRLSLSPSAFLPFTFPAQVTPGLSRRPYRPPHPTP